VALYCSRCDTPIQPGANFCMRCGNPVAKTEGAPAAAAVATPVPAHVAAPIDQPAFNRARYGPVLAIAGLIAVLFALGLVASNALQARAQNQNTLLSQGTRAPTMVANKTLPPGMPGDIHDWLEHLRRIEERKNKLEAEQVADLKMFSAKYEALGPAAGLLSGTGDDEDNTNPTAPMKQKITDMSGPWKQLIKDYQTVPPPPECQRLADEYFAGLNEIPAQASDIQSIVSSIGDGTSSDSSDASSSTSGDGSGNGETPTNKDALSKAYAMQGKSTDIDTHFKNSDQLLGDICDQYNTSKWFSISTDIGGGALSSPL
jgi:hypothetical protein